MALLGGFLARRILDRFPPPGGGDLHGGAAPTYVSKLEKQFSPKIWESFAGKTVVDFGCGTGADAVEIAQHGAGKVIGVDIRDEMLEQGARRAREAGVSDRCFFKKVPLAEKADIVLTMDAFEHFDDPERILEIIHGIVKPTGYVLVSFGPPWLHPRGGHLFSVFPWAHLLFSERSLIQWRSKFRSDGATRFREVDGGLNQMTVSRFIRMVEKSRFKVTELRCVAIRKMNFLINPLTREFFTSVVHCKLVPKQG